MSFQIFIIVNLFCVVTANYDRPEGEACVEAGVAGTCRHIRYCPTATLVDLKEARHPQICSYQGKEPIVCCTDCNQTDVTKMAITLDGIQYKLGTNKSYDYRNEYCFEDRVCECYSQYPNPTTIDCLEYISSVPYACYDGVKMQVVKFLQNGCHELVVAPYYLLIGRLAERGEFPHMALLGYGEEDSAEWLCGGSVISSRFILTAGHCGQHPRLGPVAHVALGILRRSDPAAQWQRHRVRRFISHPGYKPPSKYNDIALIQSELEIKFSELVLPICLADRELQEARGQAEGWGAEGVNKENSDGLRTAWLERFTDEECAALYPPHRHQVHGIDRRTQLCYGDHTDNKDTCQGDSGGPLQVYSADRSCVEYVFGVTSYGRACGTNGGAGVYTRVLPYLSWIEENVWP